MSDGPSYHGVSGDGPVTLSPRSAESGMLTTSSRPISSANAR